jgi:hypothetical protein
MNKFITLCATLLFCTTSLLAQSQIELCGTESTIDPNYNSKEFKIFESKFLDKVNKTDAEDMLFVPLTAHLIRRSDSTGGLSETDFLSELEKVNTAYIAGGIQFYLCGEINQINDDVYYNYDSDEQTAMISDHSVANTINIFVAETASSGGTAVCGYSYYPWTGFDFVILARSCATNGSTFAHELGHNLGLYHTHDNSQGAELVDGSNCEDAGDLLCDTPADPNLSGNVSGSCLYNGTDMDGNGANYEPDVTNMMSYSRKPCRVHMSFGQQVRAAYHIPLYKDHLDCEQTVNGDLSLEYYTVSTTELVAGTSFDVSVNALYIGDAIEVIYPSVSYFLSDDCAFSGDDTYLGASVAALRGASDLASHALSLTLDSSTLAGTYYVVAFIDNGDLISETNETNNSFCLEVTVDGAVAYLISAVSDPVGSGIITGDGPYAYNDAVTISAAPASADWDFVRWTTASGQIVSNYADYTFNVTDSADYVAVFRSTIGLDESIKELNIRLFPNPSKDVITINWAINSALVSIEITNSLGSVVWSKFELSNTTKTQMDISNMDMGVYFVNINIDGKLVTKRFLKY